MKKSDNVENVKIQPTNERLEEKREIINLNSTNLLKNIVVNDSCCMIDLVDNGLKKSSICSS